VKKKVLLNVVLAKVEHQEGLETESCQNAFDSSPSSS